MDDILKKMKVQENEILKCIISMSVQRLVNATIEKISPEIEQQIKIERIIERKTKNANKKRYRMLMVKRSCRGI